MCTSICLQTLRDTRYTVQCSLANSNFLVSTQIYQFRVNFVKAPLNTHSMVADSETKHVNHCGNITIECVHSIILYNKSTHTLTERESEVKRTTAAKSGNGREREKYEEKKQQEKKLQVYVLYWIYECDITFRLKCLHTITNNPYKLHCVYRWRLDTHFNHSENKAATATVAAVATPLLINGICTRNC